MGEYAADKVFLPYQQELARAVASAPVVVVEKSRRTGYSWAAAAVAVFETSEAVGAQNTYYMGYDYEMAREFISYVGEWAKKIGEAASPFEEVVFKDRDNPDKDIKAFRVTFANGHEVVALPSVARALRGKQGFVIIDEAAFHDDLKEVLKSAFALLIWGGKVLIISTHNGEDNAFNELIKDIRADKKPYKLLRCTFDDALSSGLYKRICAQNDKAWSEAAEFKWRKEIYDFYGDSADEELDCIPSNGSGDYFSRLIIEQCMKAGIEVLSFGKPAEFAAEPAEMREQEIADWLDTTLKPVIGKMNPQLCSGLGYDFARNGDLSVAWVMQENPDLSLNTAFVLELSNMPHESQKQIAFYILDNLPRLKYAAFDARGNGSYLAEVCWQKYGDSVVEQVMLSTEWYRANMPKAKALLEDKRVTLPQNVNILNDFKQVKLIRGVAQLSDKRVKDDKGQKRHGDSCIAYVFAAYAMKKEGVPVYDGFYSSRELLEDEDFDRLDFERGTF